MSSLKVCYQSVFVESLKFYFRPSLHIFQHFLWKICPTPGACIKPGWLPQRPLYHKVNLLGYVAQCPLCHEVNLPRCSKSSGMWRLAALFHHDLWYFQHQTNEHFSSVYVINWAKLINQPTEVPLKSLQSTHSTKLLEKLLTWTTHTFYGRLWWFPQNVWNWEVQCKWTSVQTQFIVPQSSPTSSPGYCSLALEVGWEKAPASAGHMTTKHPEFLGVLN